MAGYTPVAYATAQTTIGVGIETTKGTPAATLSWMPVKSPKYKPSLTMITDDTLQGSMVQTYGLVPGLRFDSHGWDSYPTFDTFPVMLRAVLGSADTMTVAPASTTLSAAAAKDATSVTLTAAVAASTWIVIGSGETQEAHYVVSVATNTATLGEPLRFAQASGTAVTGLTAHAFSLLNNSGSGAQPPSCTIQDFDGQQWRQLTSAQLSKLTIKGNATGLVEYTVEWAGDAATTISAPTPSFTSAQAAPGWTSQLSIGGTPIPYLEDWEIDLDRKLTEIPALTGTQNYFLHYAGPLEVTGKFTFVEQSNAPQLTAYEAGTTQSLDLTVGDIASGYGMRIHSTNTAYTSGSVERSKAYAEVQLDVTALPSAADATAGGVSPVLVSVGNGTATTY